MGVGASLVWFPCVSAAQQWFSKRRGLSVGIAISGSGFGGLILSNVIQAVIDHLGYQWALRIVGFISFVLLIIAACTVRPLNTPLNTEIKILDLRPFRNFQFVLLFAIQFIGNFAFNVSVLMYIVMHTFTKLICSKRFLLVSCLVSLCIKEIENIHVLM